MSAASSGPPPPEKRSHISRPNSSNVKLWDEAGETNHGILALVDELAILAAELWFAGKLEPFPPDEESDDDEDE
jgi:hypothetical protein